MSEHPALWEFAKQGLIHFPTKYKEPRQAVLTKEGKRELAKEEKKAAEAAKKASVAV